MSTFVDRRPADSVAPPAASRATPQAAGRLGTALPFVLLGVAVAGWLVALIGAHPLTTTNFGLLRILGPGFVVAIVAVCAAFAVEFFGASRTWVLGLMTLALVAVLRASVPLMLHDPEYAWTYKHFGITNSLSGAGGVVDPHDIYQLWPAFFAVMGDLGSAAGVDPERIGAWSSFVFGVIDGIFVFEMLRLARADRRTALLAAFVFEAAMWPDTNYFSPQAFAFALALGFWCLILRFCVQAPRTGVVTRNPFARWAAGLHPVAASSVSRVGAVVPAVAIGFVFFAITASHQLSPYMLILGVAGLTLFDLMRPRWLVLALAGIAIGYFIPNAGEVTSQYTIFNGINIFANASGNHVHAQGSTGEAVSVLAARILTFAVWLGAAAIVWRRRRERERLLVPVILAVTPFGILVAGNYGGEAIYRVILFSLPWFVYVVCAQFTSWSARASAPATARRRPRLRWTGGLAAAAALMVLASTEAAQGAFAVYAISSSEVRASHYFYAHAPAGSSLTLLVQDFPTRLSGGYVHINRGLPTDPALVDDDHRFADHPWNASVLPEIATDVRQYPGKARFLVISDRMKAYLSYFGIRQPSSIDSLKSALDRSPQWSVWYRNSDTTIYEMTGRSSR